MATQPLFDIGNVLIEPAPTFARLKTKTHAWLPLLLLIVLSGAITWWWVSTVDFAWLTDHMVAAQPDAKPEMRAAMARFMTPTSMLVSGLLGAVVGVLLAVAVSAVYYLLAGKVMDIPITYGQWFGFAAWTSVPRLLGVPLSALQILTSHGRLAPEDMNMVSLNYLALHLPLSNHWANLANAIDLMSVWSLVLAVIGLKAWTGRPTGTCVLVAALPYVVIYGLWAAKIAFFG